MKQFLKYVVSAVFAVSAVMKLIDFDNTAIYFKELLDVGFKSAESIVFVSIFVELLIAFALPFKWKGEDFVLKMVVMVLALFLGLSGAMAFAGTNNCGCFGTIWVTHPVTTVIKNGVMLIMIIAAGYRPKEKGHA